jgi:putative ABC transport system permease protein
MEKLLQDLRFGLRMLRKNPDFAMLAILILAIGIAANTTIFSLMNSMMLRPLPYPDADRLVFVRNLRLKDMPVPMTYVRFVAWKDQTNIFERAAAFYPETNALLGMGEPEEVQTLRVSADLLPMLGISPSLGRGYTPEEEQSNASDGVILTQSYWRSHFNSDPSVIGRSLKMFDKAHVIIGVLPGDFHFANDPVILLPLNLDATLRSPGRGFLSMVAKLRPGLTIEQARSAAEMALPGVNQLSSRTSFGTEIVNLQKHLLGDSGPLFLALLGSVGCVLLLACANTANLLLARAAIRQKEIAIRVSIGASRYRIVRQLLTESVLLSLIGSGLGLAMAWWGVQLMTKLFADRLPATATVSIDGYVLAFTALLSLLTGVLFGLFPALQVSKGNLQEDLKQASRGSSGSSGLRNGLVIIEIALSLVLLAGAGLLLRTFLNLLNVNKGFQSDHVLTMGIFPSPLMYANSQKEMNYLQEIIQRTETLPGVRSVGVVTALPLAKMDTSGNILIKNRPSDQRDPQFASKQFVAGNYFQALRVSLRKGRYVNDSDTVDRPLVVNVNEEFVRKYFPNEDPIGKYIDVSWGNPGWSEIVGVIGDVKDTGLSTPPQPTFYAPLFQKPEIVRNVVPNFVIRTDQDPTTLIRSVSGQIHQIDPDQPINRVFTMDQIVSKSLSAQRSPTWVFGVFGITALILASVGIYGVLSSYVNQRRKEIGIRMALGAQRTDILRLVVGHALKLIAAGVVLGLVAVFPAARVLSSLLFGVHTTDVVTFLEVSFLLATLAFLACCVPALRAIHVEPLTVLRNE